MAKPEHYGMAWHAKSENMNAVGSSLRLTKVNCGMMEKVNGFEKGGWSYRDPAQAPCHLLHRTTVGADDAGAVSSDGGSACENVATVAAGPCPRVEG